MGSDVKAAWLPCRVTGARSHITRRSDVERSDLQSGFCAKEQAIGGFKFEPDDLVFRCWHLLPVVLSAWPSVEVWRSTTRP